MNKSVIYKKTGAKQRVDTSLDKDVLNTLLQNIFSGRPIYPPQGYLEVHTESGEIRKVKNCTINQWVSRGNVIPETGRALRDLLSEAREKYRNEQREKRQKLMLDTAEKEMHRTLGVRTNLPVIGLTGVLTDKNGNIIRKENSKLLAVKMDVAKFLAKALDPNKYGDRTNNKHTHLVFSLSELRKAKDTNNDQMA